MSTALIEVIKDFEQKNEIWQWDIGRQIKITPGENAIVDEVHFSNAYSKDALVVKPQVNEQGNIVADIPNILLWQVFPINVYVVMEFPNGKGTIYEEQLKINPRKKPSDYVYTETEILNYLDLEKRIKALEENEGGIAEETDPTVPRWAKEPTKPSYTAEEVGALPSDTKIPTKTSDLANDSGFVTEGTVEITDNSPIMPSTVLTISPNGEEFNLYTAEEVDEKLTKISEEIEDLKENGTGGSENVLGAEWKLLGDVTVEEDGVTMIKIPIDNPNYNEYQFFVVLADRTDTSNKTMMVNFDTLTTNTYALSAFSVGTNKNYSGRGYTQRHCNSGWLTHAIGGIGNTQNATMVTNAGRANNYSSGSSWNTESPSAINVSLATGLDIGSRFVVYAR